jgi:cytochrome c oxidase subunit 2
MRAPVGQTVKLNVSAPDFDVIHSWWIPALGGKFDAIPGTTNVTWFNANAPGIYRGQCAEFCGIQHANMRASVEAVPREEFDAWLEREADAQAAGTSNLGKETFTGACAKCHGLAGEGLVGPRLQGNSLLDDDAAVEQVVREGRGLMPPVGKDWGQRQMDALIDYLQTEVLRGR